MMEVQKYLKEHGLAKLQEELAITVTDYPDRVVLNYNQIESPRFHPVVDECRALILHKNTWEVMARSFDRFYNIGEGHDKGLDHFRRPSADADSHCFEKVSFENVIIQEKVDGSIMSVYWDGDSWKVSTRKMAFAEGQTTFGGTFNDLFWKVASKYGLREILDKDHDKKQFTFVFELIGPANRVVTPYEEADIILIGGRHNGEDTNHRELSSTELDNLSDGWKLRRPKNFIANSPEEVIEIVESMPTMEEGVVLVWEGLINASHTRIKCKNPKFVAIAHMRENGAISPKRILTLVMTDEHHEYLGYFPDDRKYFDWVEVEYLDALCRIKNVWEKVKHIEEQKEFALTMMPLTEFSFEKGVLFACRKNQTVVEQELRKIEPKKLSQSMGLKERFAKEFKLVVEDDE